MKRLVSVLILLLCAAGVWAETSFSIGPVLNWSWADIREYVITYPSFEKLSELDWDAHNVWQYGVKTELTHNRFVFTGEFLTAPECGCGYMQDMDWFFADPSKPYYHQYPATTLTHFSEHPLKLLSKNKATFLAGIAAVKKNRFSLILGGGFQYFNIQLYGYNGYLQYPADDWPTPYSSDRPKEKTYGPGITYRQKIESVWFDVRADFILNPSFTLIAEGGISPWQKIECYDNHHKRDLDFIDLPHSAVMFTGNLSVLLNVGKRSSFILSGGIQALPYTEGNDSYNLGRTQWYIDTGVLGGTDYLGWDVSLSYRIRIF